VIDVVLNPGLDQLVVPYVTPRILTFKHLPNGGIEKVVEERRVRETELQFESSLPGPFPPLQKLESLLGACRRHRFRESLEQSRLFGG
jgi:hypothetical protein